MNIKGVVLVVLAGCLWSVPKTWADEFRPPLAVGRVYSVLAAGADKSIDLRVVSKSQGAWVKVSYANQPKEIFWLNLQQVVLIQE